MEMIAKLTQHYKSNPPRLSYGGSDGTGWKGLAFKKYPQEEADKPFEPGAVVVWRGKFEATRADLPIEYYCVVSVFLGTQTITTPDALPLHPEMEGHMLDAVVYVDMFGCIRAKAIGSATTHVTRTNFLEKKSLNERC